MLGFLTSVSSTAWINLLTLLAGKKIGTDALGNVYYTGKPRGGYKRERRWVIYNGEAEASRVPPEWHGWLHHTTDIIPGETNPLRREWQKPHQENMSGTKFAYVPPGHVLRGARRSDATGDYQAWTPHGTTTEAIPHDTHKNDQETP